MHDIVTRILVNILTALYQPFGFSLLTAVLFMFLYLYAKEKSGGDSICGDNVCESKAEEIDRNKTDLMDGSIWNGLKIVCHNWKDNFLHDSTFRRLFALFFYITMILFRTLLNRDLWMNPLSDVMGNWTLTYPNGELSTEPIENLMLFIPFSILLLWVMSSNCRIKDKLLKGKNTFGRMVWISTKTVFLFSLSIELLQLFLRLGTFQLSDLFYNTAGGCIGGVIYYIGCVIQGKNW